MAEVLPNAPLIEVVFELRWALSGSGPIEQMRTDPGYPILREEFSRAVKKLGFRHTMDMNPEGFSFGHFIDRRFYLSETQPFPLVQIGHGIFATNESAGYKWTKFKASCLKHLRMLINSYPRMTSFSMMPSLIELRYINAFPAESEKGKPRDIFTFLEDDTNLGISRPSLMERLEPLQSLSGGRIIAEYRVKKAKATIFALNFASAKTDTKKIIRMESKVRSDGKDVPRLKSKPEFVKDVSEWLERAHLITSPFFHHLIKPELLAKFQ